MVDEIVEGIAVCDECEGNIDISRGYDPKCGKRLGGDLTQTPPATRLWVGSKFHSTATTFECPDLLCKDCRRDDGIRRYSYTTGKPLAFGDWEYIRSDPKEYI